MAAALVERPGVSGRRQIVHSLITDMLTVTRSHHQDPTVIQVNLDYDNLVMGHLSPTLGRRLPPSSSLWGEGVSRGLAAECVAA